MAKRSMGLLAVLALVLPTVAWAGSLKVGQKAPDFTLPNQYGKPVHLASYHGKKNVLLAFYVLSFSSGCTQGLKAYQADAAKFEKSGTQVLGISVNSMYSNRAFGNQIGVKFQLLSDFQRKVSREYGVLSPQGYDNRTTFAINKRGIITHVTERRTNPCKPVAKMWLSQRCN